MSHSIPDAISSSRTPAAGRSTFATPPQRPQPGQRVLPLRCLDTGMQGFFSDQINRGDIPYWLAADDVCIGYASLIPYPASGTDEQEWGQDPITL